MWENTNRQKQINRINNGRKLEVKCPTCNTKSKGFIDMYLNLESFVINDDDDDDSESDDDDNIEGDDENNIEDENRNDEQVTNDTSDGSSDINVISLLSIDEEDNYDGALLSSSTLSTTTTTTTTSVPNNLNKSPPSTQKSSKAKTTSKINKLKRKIKFLQQQTDNLKEKAQQYNKIEEENDINKKELKSLTETCDEIHTLRQIDIMNIQSLQRSIGKLEDNIECKDAEMQSIQEEKRNMQSRLSRMDQYYKEEVNKARTGSMGEVTELMNNFKAIKKKRDELIIQYKEKEKECMVLERENERLKMASSLDRRSHGHDYHDSLSTSHASSTATSYKNKKSIKALKRTMEEFKEEFDKKEREEAQLEKSKLRKQEHKGMMRKSSLQARKIQRALASKTTSTSRWDLPKVSSIGENRSTLAASTDHTSRTTQAATRERSMYGSATSSRSIEKPSLSFTAPRVMKRQRSSSSKNDIRTMFKRQKSL
jgi:hypothetical protein